MRRTLIKGAAIVSMDPAIGDLRKGDVLIEGDRIAAVAPSVAASDADVIDASHMLLLPGLINGHLHTWQTGLRGLAADWTVAEYMQAMHRGLATLFRPEDIYIANLMGALNQINNGATTLVDWCHNNPTPEHTDAAIRGLDDAGIRALFLHGSPKPDPKPGQQHFSEVPMPRERGRALPQGPVRKPRRARHLRSRHSRSVLFDLRRDAERIWRWRGSSICSPACMSAAEPDSCRTGFERLLEDDLVDGHLTVVHGNDIAPDTVRRIADRGGTFTVTAEIELQMGYGDPLTGIFMRRRRRSRSAPTSSPPSAATCSPACG